MNDGEQDIETVEAGATAFLTGLLDAFGLDGTVSATRPAEGEIEVAVEGDELGLLVGPKGQTLLAIQDLTRLVAQRHVGPAPRGSASSRRVPPAPCRGVAALQPAGGRPGPRERAGEVHGADGGR